MLRILFGIAVVAFMVWGGYWFAGSRVLDRAVNDWIAETPAFSADDVAVRGFPNRFDVTLTRPAWADGATGWQAPFAQAFALSYRPHHLIAVLPNDQTITLGGQDWAVFSEDMRASFYTRPRTDLELERATLVVAAPRLRGPQGEALQAAEARLASRADEDDPLRHAVGVEILSLRIDPALRAVIDPAGALPAKLERLHIDVEVDLDRIAALRMAEPPRPLAITLRDARLDWGGLSLAMEGALRADAGGLVSGDLEARVTNWRLLLDAARAAALWDEGMDPMITALLGGLAREDGDEATLTLPLRLDRGMLYLGPFALARVPAI